MLKIGVVGCTGYSGQELVDIILKHPEVSLTCLTARFDEPKAYADVYPRFEGRTSLVCEKLDIDTVSAKTDLVFLALPHTISMDIAPKFLAKGKKVIDLSADYRLDDTEFMRAYGKEHSDKENLKNAVYGLTELNNDKIASANLIANPGCYPTSVELALLPIIEDIKSAGVNIIVDSKSGTSGAGRKSDVSLSFSEVNGNFKCYKANEHQHIPEMEKVLGVKINFTPHLLPISRGILSTIYIEHNNIPDEGILREKFMSYYGNKPFVRIKKAGQMPEIKDVVGTNYCDIGMKVARGMIIIVSVIDNLLKGASGQAVQNMNIMCGFNEEAGL